MEIDNKVSLDLVPGHPKLMGYLQGVMTKYPFLKPSRDDSVDSSLVGWMLKGYSAHNFQLIVQLVLPNVDRVNFIDSEASCLNAYLASRHKSEQAKIEEVVGWIFMTGKETIVRGTIDGVPTVLFPAIDQRLAMFCDDDISMMDNDDDDFVDRSVYKRPSDMELDFQDEEEEDPNVTLARIRSRRKVKGGRPGRGKEPVQPYPNDLFDSANSFHFLQHAPEDNIVFFDTNNNDDMLQ